MPIAVQQYKCSKCHSIFSTFDRAASCEAIPVPEPRFKVGDEIHYGTEEGGFGSHWCYSGASGKVIGRRPLLMTGGKHFWLYAVEEEHHLLGTYICGVLDREGSLQSDHELRRITLDSTFQTV